jgi:hypothetical protein
MEKPILQYGVRRRERCDYPSDIAVAKAFTQAEMTGYRRVLLFCHRN